MMMNKPYIINSSVLILLLAGFLFLLPSNFGFWNGRLDVIIPFIPLLIAILLFVNSVVYLSKDKKFNMFGLFFSIALFLWFSLMLLLNSFFHPMIFQESMLFSNDRFVDVILDYNDEAVVFVQKYRVFNIFAVKQCLYWGISYKAVAWEVYDEDTLLVKDQLNGEHYVDLSNSLSRNPCSCYNSGGVEYRLCEY